MLKRYRLIDGAPAPAADGPLFVYSAPDAEERDAIRTSLKVDEHTLASALDPDEVSRVEVTQDCLLLIWKRPRRLSGKDALSFEVASLGLFLFADRLVIVASEDIEPGGAGHGLPGKSPLDAMLGLLFETTHHYLGHLRVMKTLAKELQEKINTSMENRHLIQMFSLSEGLVHYLSAISANGASLALLRVHASEKPLLPHAAAFIDDLIVENSQCYKQAEIYATVFSALMDARGSLVNNNMNVLLKKLTVINTVFLPLNLLASIGGMSEYTMMTRPLGWRAAYAVLCILMAGVGWATVAFLRRVDRPASRGENADLTAPR